MTSAQDDLRATQDSIMVDADRLKQLERQKQRLDAGDPALAELSAEVEQLSEEVGRKATVERELAEEIEGNEASSDYN